MALIKYYNLESNSWEVVSNLERNLQKHLLNGRHIKSLLDDSGEEKDLEKLIYDSGNFDVLYRSSEVITKGKKGWFRRYIPPTIATEMVIYAMPWDILELQDYLSSSGFEVVEARNISRANLNFATHPCAVSAIKAYVEIISSFIKIIYPLVRSEIKISNNVCWDGENGDSCMGLCEGEVIEILRLRKQIISSGNNLGTKIKRSSVNFY